MNPMGLARALRVEIIIFSGTKRKAFLFGIYTRAPAPTMSKSPNLTGKSKLGNTHPFSRSHYTYTSQSIFIMEDEAISESVPTQDPPPQQAEDPVNTTGEISDADETANQSVESGPAPADLFNTMNELNERANSLVRIQNFKLAIEYYKQAIKTANPKDFENLTELNEKYRDLRIRIISNVALCTIKLGDFETARSA